MNASLVVLRRAGGVFARGISALYSTSGKVRLTPTVNFEQFEECRNSKTATIIDVREPEELTEHGAIPSAVNIPLGAVDKAFLMDEQEFQRLYSVPKPKADDPVIFLCRKGIRAEDARLFVATFYAYSNAATYTGSFTEWAANQSVHD